jgi:hypothetical protein
MYEGACRRLLGNLPDCRRLCVAFCGLILAAADAR